MPWSMSAAEATPSSSMRMASRPRATPSRLVAKPGESRTSMLSLPRRLTHCRASSTAAGAVASPTTSSTRAERGTGLKKCMPRNRSGRSSAPARSVIESELVLLASRAVGGTTFSAAARRSRLASGISGMASTTNSTLSGSDRSVTVLSRPERASTSSPETPLRRHSPSMIRPRASAAAPMVASTTTTSQPASSRTWAMPAPMVPPPITAARPPPPPSAMVLILRAGRWSPENGQQAGGTAAAGDQADEEAAHGRVFEDAHRVVERPFPCTEAGDAQSEEREGHDVLVALARPEDEEPVLQVVGDPGDQHGADDAGAGQRREEADEQQRAGSDLGETGQPGVQDAGLHSEALEPSACSGDLPTAEDVVDPVGEEDDAEHHPEQEQRDVDGYGVRHRAILSGVPRPPWIPVRRQATANRRWPDWPPRPTRRWRW